MRLTDVKPGYYIDCGAEYNDKDPNFKVGHRVIISN